MRSKTADNIFKRFLLLAILLGAASASCVVDQPILTYGDRPGTVVFSVVAPLDCPSAPLIVLYNEATQTTEPVVADFSKEYSKSVHKVMYEKVSYFFTARITPGVKYSWYVYAENELGPFKFSIKPSTSGLRSFGLGQTTPARYAMIADADISPLAMVSLSALRRINWSQYDGLIHAGDFAYDVDTDNGQQGDAFFNGISDIIAQAPYLVVAGNHENYDDAELFDYRFKMPGYDEKYANNLWTFQRGPILFTFINYDYCLKLHKKHIPKMVERLDERLKQYSNDPTVKWRVVISHRPIYCGWVEKKDCTINFYMLKPFEDLFRKHNFDLVLASHEHIYERLKFFDKWAVVDVPSETVGGIVQYTDPKLPVTVICGLFGNREEFPLNSDTFDVNFKSIFGIQSFLDLAVTESSFEVRLVASKDGEVLDGVRVLKTQLVPARH